MFSGVESVVSMMRRSFSEALGAKNAPEYRAQIVRHEAELEALPEVVCLFGEPDIEDYFAHKSVAQEVEREVHASVVQGSRGEKLLREGRVVMLRSGSPAVVVRGVETREASLDVVEEGQLRRDVSLAEVRAITKHKLRVDCEAVLGEKKGAAAEVTLALRAEGELELLDPVRDLKMNDMLFVERWSLHASELGLLEASKCHGCAKLDEHYSRVARAHELQREMERLRLAVSVDHLQLFPDLEARIRVLRKLNYIDANSNIMIKGRIAREINSCDELVATEMILENVLTDLSPEEAVALLSLLVFEQKSDVAPKLTARLDVARKRVEEIATRLAQQQIECGMELTVKEYLRNLRPGLMEVCYEWAQGNTSFAEIMNLTDVLEGSIVRNIKRLDETLGEFRNAARIIGDSALSEKMEAASAKIKRDIIFSSSLYLSTGGQ